MFKLPKELINYIYFFDNTYHNYYRECINEMKEIWKQQHIDYILWRADCC
jgi:flavorubredoxin